MGSTAFLSPQMLEALEKQALMAGRDLDRMLTAFQTALRGITTMSVQHLATYRTAVDNTSEAFHQSIARMTEFVHKCAQLNEDMKAVGDIVVKVREIKKVVDVLEKTASKIPALR